MTIWSWFPISNFTISELLTLPIIFLLAIEWLRYSLLIEKSNIKLRPSCLAYKMYKCIFVLNTENLVTCAIGVKLLSTLSELFWD